MSTQKKIAGATTALVLLTLLNLVNYIDRYILPGVQELIKAEFHLSDQQLGSLTTWFFITYIVAAPLTGWLGDRYSRKPLIVVGVLLWSAMNLFTATVHTYPALLLRHAALGIGEASFGIYALAVLSDFYSAEDRNRMMTIFNLAIPSGAAIGYTLAGVLGGSHGWRTPFFVSAIPGIVLALIVAFVMREPSRGEAEVKSRKVERSTILALAKNPAYVTAILGYAMVTFTVGGLSWWIPSFLQRFHNDTSASAGFTMGALTAVGGFLGTAVGGIWAQRWLKTDHRALYFVSACSSIATVPFILICFFGPTRFVLPSLAASLFLIFLGSGPLNAAILNSVNAKMRATALAGELLFIHLLGDAPSPRIIGAISDATNLRLGLGVTVIALGIATAIFLYGARFAPRLEEA